MGPLVRDQALIDEALLTWIMGAVRVAPGFDPPHPDRAASVVASAPTIETEPILIPLNLSARPVRSMSGRASTGVDLARA